MADYGEIFCTAVNEIVKQQIGQINFDLTKECTVVSVQNKKNSEYLVSDGSNTFKAYAAAGASYIVGDQVLISIPEGDYNKQKTIVNKIVSDESSPIGYVSPLDNFIAGTGNIIQVAGPESIAANGSESLKLLFTLDDSQKNLYFGFTRIALTAEFMTLLDNLGIVTGEYGLKLLVTDASGSVAELTFSADKMLGNPYMFNTYFHQECVFTVPDSIKDINSIQLYLYQDGNFTDGKKALTYEDKIIDNIFVKNINVILGFSSNHATSEIVQITADNTSYQKDDNTRYPTLQWFHLVDTGVFEPINSNNWEEKKQFCDVRWYQYEPGCPEDDTDEYGDKNWRWLNQPENLAGVPGNYPFSYPITLSERKETEKIKVVTIYTEYPLQNNPTHEKKTNYTSNVLEFTNTTEETQGGTQTDEQVKEDLSLFFTDNSYGNYFWYDQNGVLIDAANEGSSKLRTVEIRAKGVTLNADWESYKAIDWIKWEIPANDDATMIMPGSSTTFSNPNSNILSELNTGVGHIDTGDFNFTAKVSGLTAKKISKIKIILSMLVNNNWDAPHNRPITTVISTGGQDSKDVSVRFKINRTHTAIKINFEYYDQDNNEITNETGVSVTDISLKPKTAFLTATTDKDGISLSYFIKNNWTQSRDNNNIKCTVSVNGVPHILTETLRFGPKGSSGTANTFLLEMLEGKNALQVGIDNTLKVQAMLIGGNGKRINFTDDEKAKIEWTLIHGNNQHMVLTSSGDVATLTSKTATLPSNNYAILQAKYKHSQSDAESGKTPYLYAFLPIPIKTENCTGMQGATQIIYNHQGVPKYSNQAYIAFGNEGQELRGWCLQQESTNPNPVNLVFTSDAQPSLALKASPLYSKNNNEDIIADKVCVYCTEGKFEYEVVGEYSHHGTDWICHLITIPENLTLNDNTVLRVRFKTAELSGKELWVKVKQGDNISNYKALQYNGNQVTEDNPYTWEAQDEIQLVYHSGVLDGYEGYFTISDNIPPAALWSQPVLIMQSQYDFAMLNSWDGNLTIDNDNGIILSTMLGAGKKDGQNRFSGVLIGDIKDGTDLNNTEKMTGVYGFDKGVMSYGLKENGSAFFGAAANGRIEIDGTSGIIKSAGWIKDGDNWRLKTQEDQNNNLYEDDVVRDTGVLIGLSDGLFKLQGSGLDIKLIDKTGNPSLSGYIDATARGLTSEFRRTAVYTITCTSTGVTKALPLEDFSKAAFKSNDVGISDLTPNDILQDGVTIAVTFTNAENVTVTQIPIVQVVDGEEKEIGKREKRTGRQLNLALQKNDSIIDNTTKLIYINGKATNEDPSIDTTKDKLTEQENEALNNNTDSNPYGWAAGSTVYFTYDASLNDNHGAWRVSDSGSYSRITQTADMIKSEVSNVAGNLGSSITQTAGKIRMEVAEKANYKCRCETGADNNHKYIRLTETDYDKLTELVAKNKFLDSGATITVQFDNGNSKETTYFQLCSDTNPVGPVGPAVCLNPNVLWEPGETLSFVYDGSQWTMTSLSNSAITQTANSITSEVRRKGGLACTASPISGGWQLDIKATDANGNKYTWEEIKNNNEVIAVTFTGANTSNNLVWLKDDAWRTVYLDNEITGKNNSLKWDSGATLYFYYKSDTEHGGYTGSWCVVDSGAYSKIQQTASNILAEVVSKNGENVEKGFKWNLTADGFKLSSKLGTNNYTDIFDCNHGGLTIVPNTFTLVSGNGTDGMVQLKTNPSSNTDYYFAVGTDDQFMRFSKDKGLEVKGEITATKLTIADNAIPSNIAKPGDIPTEEGIVSIVKGTVTADYINAFSITANSIEVKDSNSKVVFKASGTTAQISSWDVDYNSIRTGSLGASGSLWISTGTNTYASIGGSDNINSWAFAVGSHFGITTTGNIYMSGVKSITYHGLYGDNGSVITVDDGIIINGYLLSIDSSGNVTTEQQAIS